MVAQNKNRHIFTKQSQLQRAQQPHWSSKHGGSKWLHVLAQMTLLTQFFSIDARTSNISRFSGTGGRRTGTPDANCTSGFAPLCPGYTFPPSTFINDALLRTSTNTACEQCEGVDVIVLEAGDCEDWSGWTDLLGNPCSLYGGPGWCAAAEYAAVNGFDARHACCHCGGGSLSKRFLDLGPLTFPGGGDVTYTARIKVDAANRWSRVFDFGNGEGQDNHLLAFSSNTGRLTFHSYDGSTLASNPPIQPSALPLNQWHHVAVTVAGTTASLYLNGMLSDAGGGVGVSSSLSSNYIGWSNWNHDSGFEGSIADFRVFGRALSAGEISALSNGSFASNHDLLPFFSCTASTSPTCVDVDECETGDHNCAATVASCANSEGSFECMCNVGYAGDGVDCANTDECALGTHDCDSDANCVDTTGSFTCACNAGYSGNGVVCLNDDECALGTATCVGNSQCIDIPGSFVCPCRGGWTSIYHCSSSAPEGPSCSVTVPLSPAAGNPRITIRVEQTDFQNETEYLTSVLLDGQAVSLLTDLSSEGHENACGTYVTVAQDVALPAGASNVSIQIATSLGVNCCPCEGQYLNAEVEVIDGGCSDVDECRAEIDDCHANAACANTQGSFTCTCNLGYSGDGVTCDDDDACITVDGRISCYQDLAVTTSWASAVALCEAEGGHLPVVRSRAESDFLYSLTGQQTWLGLTRNQQSSPVITDYEWVTGEPARQVPNISIEIDDGSLGSDCLLITDSLSWGDNCNGQHAVVCQKGSKCVTGYRSSGDTCVDNNECALGTDTCDAVVGTCTNTPGSFTCACNAGWELVDRAGSSCTDVFECGYSDNCDADATCINGNGSFACICPDDTLDWNSDGTLCDVDECVSDLLNLCDSNSTCVNTAGSFECHCNDWFGTPNKTHFSFAFEGGENLSSWSQILVDSTDSTTFLGRFDVNNPNVSLTLTDLLPHTELILDFEFYRLDSWNAEAFSIDVDGNQVFRNSYQSASNDSCAIEEGGNLLFGSGDHAVYHYRMSLPHTGGSAVIRFSAGVTQTKIDSSWGIDNVNVTLHSAGSEEYVGASTIQGSCETCSDGIQNQNENGVDTGGVCDPEEHEERRHCFPVTECIEEVHDASCFDYAGDSVHICPILHLCFLHWTHL